MSAGLLAPPKETDEKRHLDPVDHMACVINGTDGILAYPQTCSSQLCKDNPEQTRTAPSVPAV